MSDNQPWNWNDKEQDDKPAQSKYVVDLSFRLTCQCLHVDHTVGLHEAITASLPWFIDEPLAGLHLIYVAGSQNGWMRPEEPDELLHLSRRTRLQLRVPIHRVQDARQLSGQTLDIAGNSMTIGESAEKPVLPNDILFTRHMLVQADNTDDENEFLQAAAGELKDLGIAFRKLLPGKQLKLRTPQGITHTRSLMVADIDHDDSLILQEQGLGEGRHFGCGIFIHHKGIKAVNPDDLG